MAFTLNSYAGGDRFRFLRTMAPLGLTAALGLFGGALSATGHPEITAIFIGLVIALLIVSSRVAVFWFVMIGGLIVAGAAQLYLPGSRYVRYVVPLASFALLLHWLSDYFNERPREQDEPLPAPVAWALGIAMAGLASVFINLNHIDVALMGAKNYFQMWGLFFGVAFLRWKPGFAKQMLVGLMLIALVQIPFAAHEYLFLVPRRIGMGEGIVPVDIVAGTFGAQLFGGGANAVLAAYQIIMVGLLLALWKNGVVSAVKASLLGVVLLAPLLFNQAKISVIYLPLVFVVIFYRDLVARPMKFILAGAGMAGITAVLVMAIILTYPGGRVHSFGELVDYMVARQTASIDERQGYSELSRFTALTFWAKEHVTANPANTLLGHGLGASREPDVGVVDTTKTLAEEKYPGLNIGYTALSALLWDTGVVGLVLVLGMFGSAFLMAGRLARFYRSRDPFLTGTFEGLQAAMAVLTLSLAHKDFFVVNLPFQAFVYLLIGFIVNQWLRVTRAESPRYAD